MAYTISNPLLAPLPIAGIDTGVIPANNANTGSTTTVPTGPMFPGMIVAGNDPTLGGAEFILLKGVASTIVGSVVIYNTTNYTTTLCPVTANLGQPVAFSMSANTSNTSWSWYQIGGLSTVAKSAVALSNNVAIGINSVGKIGAVASGKQILNARTGNSTVSATTTAQIMVDRPGMQGRTT